MLLRNWARFLLKALNILDVDQNVNIDIWAITPNLHNFASMIYIVDPWFKELFTRNIHDFYKWHLI